MLRAAAFILSVCLPIAIYCSEAALNALPHSMTAGNTQTARTDVWSAFGNPASLVQEERWQAGIGYENRYFTSELSTASVQAGYCNRYVNVGIGYSFFGYNIYNEMMATIVLARSFGRFSIGLAADFIAVYGGNHTGYLCTAIPQIGLTINATEKLTFGIQTFNPFIQTLNRDELLLKLPAIYTVGSDWRFIDGLRWSIEAEYDASSTWRIATGVEWQAIRELCLKIGVQYRQYVIPSLGIGMFFGNFSADVNADIHPVLGVALSCRLAYKWK